jgi:transcriptional regulator with XRE-family HTH domain
MPGKRVADGNADRSLLTNYIRHWRKHRNLTLKQLAATSGLSVSTVSEIERHSQDFTGKTLRQF